MTESPLLSAHALMGARIADVAGVRLPRAFGDPADEYAAALHRVGLADRGDLAVVRMWGRDPVKMMQGLITHDLAGAPPGQGVLAAVLTPKGRMLAELRAFTRTTPDGTEVLILTPREALEPLTAHLRKFVPPMFARWADESDRWSVIGVYGPGSRELVGRVSGTDPGDVRSEAFGEPGFGTEPLVVARTDEVADDGYDLVIPTQAAPALWEALLAQGVDLGARPVGHGTLHTLRVERGRPRYGPDLTEKTIPTEAYAPLGMLERVISFGKGCYTGQEVIVRIAHRGHVNRHLRGLLLGDGPAPAPDTPLLDPESGKEVGWITSTAVSPRVGQTVAMGFVRREYEPGTRVRVGENGPTAPVTSLPFEAA